MRSQSCGLTTGLVDTRRRRSNKTRRKPGAAERERGGGGAEKKNTVEIMADFRASWSKESREDATENDDDWEVLSEDSCELEGFVLPEKIVTKWRSKYAPPTTATGTPTGRGPSLSKDSNEQEKILDHVEPVNTAQWESSMKQHLSGYDGADGAKIVYEDDQIDDIPENMDIDMIEVTIECFFFKFTYTSIAPTLCAYVFDSNEQQRRFKAIASPSSESRFAGRAKNWLFSVQ